jgi:hypothetical protein
MAEKYAMVSLPQSVDGVASISSASMWASKQSSTPSGRWISLPNRQFIIAESVPRLPSMRQRQRPQGSAKQYSVSLELLHPWPSEPSANTGYPKSALDELQRASGHRLHHSSAMLTGLREFAARDIVFQRRADQTSAVSKSYNLDEGHVWIATAML